MPLYDYKCNNCGHRFEDFNSIDNRYNATCPKCGGFVSIIPSVYSFRMSIWGTVRAHDGTVLNSKQFPQGIPPPRLPTPEERDSAAARGVMHAKA